MRKIYLIFSLLLLMCGTVLAQDTGLYVNLKTGESKVINLKEVQSVTFDGSNVSINGKAQQQFAMSEIRSLKIKEYTGIAEQAGEDPYQVIITESEILFPSLGGARADISIYTAGGQLVISEKGWSGYSMNISALASNNFYILKVNDKSFKFKK